MIEPDNNRFPWTDFSGGKTGDAWWAKSPATGVDLWGERWGDEFDVTYSRGEGFVMVGLRGETVGLNMNQQLIAVYDRWSGDLKSFSAGLARCILEMSETDLPVPIEAIDLVAEFIGHGQDILATVDITENKLSFWQVNQAGAQLLGEATLPPALPNKLGYTFAVRTPTSFPGVSLEVGLTADKVDLFLFGEGDKAMNFPVSKWVDLGEILKQKHPNLPCIKKLVDSTFLALETGDHDR